MVYMVLGVLFVILCGVDIAYSSIFLATDDPDEPELEGHPVKFNKTGALIPVVIQNNHFHTSSSFYLVSPD
jgi:hypothetical protein